MRTRARAFTLIELLVVVSIIALLLAILLPSLRDARRQAKAVRCAANMRHMEMAHWLYLLDNREWFVNVGLAEGGAIMDESVAWINTLQKYYKDQLLHRSPADTSPHWGPYPQGEPIPGAPPEQRRRTSYGINNFLTDASHNGLNPYGPPPPGFPLEDWPGGTGGAYMRLNRVKTPAATIHFLIMAYTGNFAGADHTHIESLMEQPAQIVPRLANQQMQINAHGGHADNWDGISNYGFLDGHVETLRFSRVFKDINTNNFDPRVAH